MTNDITIVGAGIFGVTAAMELRQRGYRVTLCDPGPIPHELAASTDISKVVRMEYADDEQYTEMLERSLPGWHAWNERFGERLFHDSGVLMLTRDQMAPGGYVYESYQTALRRGHTPERLDAGQITRRFPAWRKGAYVDGFYHAKGGFVESGRAVAVLANVCRVNGVHIRDNFRVARILQTAGHVSGVESDTGETIHSSRVVVAAGAWTTSLVPELKPFWRITGHPVFHLKTDRPDLFDAAVFPTFTADIAHSGWYGFPLHPRAGVIKMANHGVGLTLGPDDPRIVTETHKQALRLFLRDAFPVLADAEIVYTRLCLYSDTLDEHFWIDRHPDVAGLTIASGGSGHGFKFAPVLGQMVADAVEGKENDWLQKFAWRNLTTDVIGQEPARFRGG